MTPEQYRKTLDRLNLSIVGAAPVLGVSPRQAQRYAAGDPIPGPVSKLLRIMVDRRISPEEVERL